MWDLKNQASGFPTYFFFCVPSGAVSLGVFLSILKLYATSRYDVVRSNFFSVTPIGNCLMINLRHKRGLYKRKQLVRSTFIIVN